MKLKDKINEIKRNLPLPSEVKSKYLVIPCLLDQVSNIFFDEINICPAFRSITFEKEYYNGICIGWKVSDK